MDKYITAIAEPDASSMIETFRAIGYSLETAIADIMDNSISAKAKNIWLNYEWKGDKTIIQIADDGHGMTNDELIQAMRPGSKHPTKERVKSDLGRFGLGLKTASFSQTKKFTVISKKENYQCVYWAWDLDHVNEKQAWELIRYTPEKKVVEEYENKTSGTTVIWYCLDRNLKNIKEDDTDALSKFMELMEGVKNHLEMVFHRYLEQRKIKIWFQDRELNAWDPILRGTDGLQAGTEEFLGDGNILVKGYVLPHKSKITESEFKKASGPKGWNEQQGFYIYRNQRLLCAGNWLGMFRKEEHYKLCRIMIDIPNTVLNDGNWQIDIKKSIARPPIKVRNQLKAYARDIRNKAVSVYRHKGKVLQRKYPSFKFVPVWNEKSRRNKRYYSINRSHPIIKEIIEQPTKQSVATLLRFIEETIPVPLITIKESEEPDSHGTAFENLDHEVLHNHLKVLFKELLLQGKNSDEAASILLSIEPFDKYPQYINSLIEDND